VDGAAHRGALEGGGLTVAVLGNGLAHVYPPEHAPLAPVIAANGAIVSELAPDAPPLPDHFPRRNRIISGLALGVVVVEASLKSGSLITARLALEQGREVMAVPGGALGGRHTGGHSLIRDGAALVETAADVVDALGLRILPDGAGGGAASGAPPVAGGPARDPILAALDGGEALTADALAQAAGLALDAALGRISLHEMAGRVTRLPGGAYRAVRTPVVR
jgi:DNA processing protein